MPLVDIVHRPELSDATLRALACALPDLVSRAVECRDEPYDGRLRPGDVELRFRPNGSHDVAGLDAVIEIRSKWTDDRAADRDRRCRLVVDGIAALGVTGEVGVHLSLPVAGWAQG